MDNNKDKPITKIEQAQKVIKSWRTLEEQRIIDNLQLQGRTPNAEDFYGLSSQIRLMRELPFDTLAEVMHHAVRQDHRVSMEYLKTFREKYHWCFITHQRREIDKDEKDVIHLSELKAIICDWIDGAVHKEFLQRKCFKLDLFDFLQKIKLDLPVEYKNKLSHLDDVQPIDNLKLANKEKIEHNKIDEERLKAYFRISFQRNGIETLKQLLKNDHDPKGYAMIAHQIYISKHFRKEDFRGFSKWYRTFCEIVGCKCFESYKPSKLKPTKEQEVTFYFLK